jgi:hypothetical protein
MNGVWYRTSSRIAGAGKTSLPAKEAQRVSASSCDSDLGQVIASKSFASTRAYSPIFLEGAYIVQPSSLIGKHVAEVSHTVFGLNLILKKR